MGTGIPPGVPGGGWSVSSDDGGGRRRKRKRRGFFRELGSLILWTLIAALFVLAVFAAPLLMGFDPVDAADFVDAPGLAKIDAFQKGLRHKRGISEMTFSHNGRTITFTDDNGTLSEPSGDGTESDIEEARRILKEWGWTE